MIDIRKIKHGYWWAAQDKFLSLTHKINSLKEITIQVTDLCNKNCAKCNKVNMTSKHMDTKEVIRIIDEAVKLGLKHVHFTGGEPTMHPDFLDIIKHCRDYDLRVDMSTNGMFDSSYGRKLSKSGINSVNVSWDFIRDVPKCFEHINSLKMDLFVNHMVMPANFQELSGFLFLIKNSRGWDRLIDIQLMPPRGTAEKFTKDQVDWFNKVVVPESLKIAKGRFPMVEAKLLEILPEGAEKGIYHRPIKWPCHRSKAELRVGCSGFTTCTYLYRDGKVTCGLHNSVKDAWGKCRTMAKKAPPSKMCELSCSPEVSGFNEIVELALLEGSNHG